MLFNQNCVGTVNTATLVSFTHLPRRYLPPHGHRASYLLPVAVFTAALASCVILLVSSDQSKRTCPLRSYLKQSKYV